MFLRFSFRITLDPVMCVTDWAFKLADSVGDAFFHYHLFLLFTHVYVSVLSLYIARHFSTVPKLFPLRATYQFRQSQISSAACSVKGMESHKTLNATKSFMPVSPLRLSIPLPGEVARNLHHRKDSFLVRPNPLTVRFQLTQHSLREDVMTHLHFLSPSPLPETSGCFSLLI